MAFMDYDTFITARPEFASVDVTAIEAFLVLAEASVQEATWGALQAEGHMLLTAHLLALSPHGQMARLESKDGPSSTYWPRYEELCGIVACCLRAF